MVFSIPGVSVCVMALLRGQTWLSVHAQMTPLLDPAEVNGNSTARLVSCGSYPAPPAKYLDVNFLGDRQFMEADGVYFSYFQFGPLTRGATGQALVMVVGLRSTASNWNPDLLQTLAAQRQVIIFDNRGTGMSVPDSDPAQAQTVDGFASSTVQLIRYLELDQPDIFGTSFGGFVALTIAVDYGDMVNHVVMADTSSGGLLGTSNQTRAYGQYYNSLPADGPEVMTLLYPDTAAGNSGLCRHLAFQQVMPNDTLLSNQSAGELAATATYTRDPTSHIFHSLGNITNPVLVLGGTLDIRISIADLYTLVDYIPDASLVLLDSAGHESVQQYAITAGGIISDFLDEQSTPE